MKRDLWRQFCFVSPFRWQYRDAGNPVILLQDFFFFKFSLMEVLPFSFPSEMHDSLGSTCMPGSSWAILRDFRKYISRWHMRQSRNHKNGDE